MHKKIRFLLILILSLSVLSGCADSKEASRQPEEDSSGGEALPGAEYLTLAAQKQAEYSVVSLLENNEPVRKFMADLLIKTRASYTLCEKADGKAIYIGTADQLKGQGGTSTALTYTKYELRLDGEDIYICIAEETMAEKAFTHILDCIEKTGDLEFSMDKNRMGFYDVVPISETVPLFETGEGRREELHDCGSNNYMVRYSGLKAGDVWTEIAAYEAKLTDSGYALYQANAIGENRFATFVKGDTMVHCNYFAPMREYRIIYGPKTAMFTNTPVTEYEDLVTPSVSIIKGTENVECMVVQLADGSFFVIDGGWNTSGWQTKMLNSGEANEMEIRYYRDAEADMETLYHFLKDNTPGGDKPQVTWMITHADPDHILLPNRFIGVYKELIDLNMAIYNFPNLYNIGLGESGGSTNDPLSMTALADNFIKVVSENFPDAGHYIYHTGDVMFLPGGQLEFLFTPEDYYPNPMPWMNHTSGIWRFTIAGRTILIPGDAEKGLCEQMVGVFGDYLASDILQTNHHGANGASLGFYMRVNPTVCFWCCQQYHLDYDNRQLGLKTNFEYNAFLRKSEKVIAHYSNSETHTVLLPSLEEKKQ